MRSAKISEAIVSSLRPAERPWLCNNSARSIILESILSVLLLI